MTNKRGGERSPKSRRDSPLMQTKDSLQRSTGFRTPRKTVLVLCEGKRSEPEYIKALSLEPDVREIAAVNILLESNVAGFAPLTLVRHAVGLRQRANEERAEIDEVWCVFDVEWAGGRKHHPKLKEAIQTASTNDVYVAVSNPSFELWLILHYRDQTAFLLNSAAEKLRAECDGSKDKGVNGKLYMDKRPAAIRRAALLDKKHEGDLTRLPNNNPSSGMWLLLESVMKPPVESEGSG